MERAGAYTASMPKPARAPRPVAPPAPEPNEIASLTGLRGLAAVGVLGLHAIQFAGYPAGVPAPLAWLLKMGWAGVDVFFVLSAFLLSLPFARAALGTGPAPERRRYFRRRVLRIVPAYYVQLLVLLLLGALGVAGAGAWEEPEATAVAAHLFLWFDAWPLVPAHLPHWWTLPVEMGFYLLLPALAWTLRGRRWVWLLVVIVASLAWRVAMFATDASMMEKALWSNHVPGRLHQFAVGMLAAAWFVRHPRGGGEGGRAWLGVAAIAIFIALPALGFLVGRGMYTGAPSPSPVLVGWHLFASIAVAVLLVVLARGAGWLGVVLAAPPLRLLGVVSYSLYLWHFPVLLALRESMGGHEAAGREFAGFLLAGFFASVAVAAASWWLVERPAQRFAMRA
jgi:peptidoglycan/LPS O-acetylase OafA/YrhL